VTPEAQRIAIAEACGWKTEYRDAVSSVTALPDYLNNLNAMHEAEKVLVSLQWVSYLKRLQTLCDESVTWPIHATSSQRAEAFLRTIKKWEDAKP
jgi:hypothetical protein